MVRIWYFHCCGQVHPWSGNRSYKLCGMPKIQKERKEEKERNKGRKKGRKEGRKERREERRKEERREEGRKKDRKRFLQTIALIAPVLGTV